MQDAAHCADQHDYDRGKTVPAGQLEGQRLWKNKSELEPVKPSETQWNPVKPTADMSQI